jgi:hypothetical protein
VVGESITVDRRMPVRDLAFALRGLRPDDVSYLTLPMAGPQSVDGDWVQLPDEAVARVLFAAMIADGMATYVQSHPPNDVTRGR